MGSNIITESAQRLAEQRERHDVYRVLLPNVVRVPNAAFDAANERLPIDHPGAEHFIRAEADELIDEANLTETLRGLTRHYNVKTLTNYLHVVASEAMEDAPGTTPIIGPVASRLREDEGIDANAARSDGDRVASLQHLAILLEVADRLTVV